MQILTALILATLAVIELFSFIRYRHSYIKSVVHILSIFEVDISRLREIC